MLPLTTAQALGPSASTPGPSSSNPQRTVPTPVPTTALNFAQHPLVVPGFPLLNGVPVPAMTIPMKGPSPIIPPMASLINPLASASTSSLTLGPQQDKTGDPVQRAIAQAVAHIANSKQTPELRQAVEIRKQRFIHDCRVMEIEPHRVRCDFCKSWSM